jgi:hypothetical protein
MTQRIILRTGEALIVGGPPGTAAEPEIVIGELDGPVGTAIATLTGMIAPIMTMFVGGIIGFVYAAFLVAMFAGAGGSPK